MSVLCSACAGILREREGERSGLYRVKCDTAQRAIPWSWENKREREGEARMAEGEITDVGFLCENAKA